MRPIKIAQIITRLDWGGSTDVVRCLCENLNKNYEITLISGLTKNPSLKTQEFLKNFKGKIIFIPYLRREINLFYDFLTFIKLYLLFRKEKFDIVHAHTSKASALARLAASFVGIKVIIYSTHGHIFYGYFNRFISKLFIFLERFLSNFCDAIVVSTLLEKNDFLRFKIAKSDKLVLIYPGLEFNMYKRLNPVEKRKEFGIKENEKVVGLISRLEAVKGVLYFLEAAKLILKEKKDIKFIIAGDGSLKKTVIDYIQSNLGANFIFLGWQEDICKIFSLIDILVVPSLNEAVGRVILEAHYLGVCVIATKVGGIPEITVDKKTALLVEPKNPYQIKDAVISLLEDENLAKNLIANAYQWVIERFSYKRFIEEAEALYKKLLFKKSKSHY